MKISIIAFSLSLAACTSCRRTPADTVVPAPAPAPAPAPVDAAVPPAPPDVTVVSDAGSAASAPTSPCAAGILGPAKPFCDGDLPITVAVHPELPSAKSKLYHGITDATTRGRILVRYVAGAPKLKVVVLVENIGKSPASLSLHKKGVAGPTTNFVKGEELAFERWTSSVAKPAVAVAPGKSVRLDPSLEVGLPEGYATLGLYEYSFSQPHAVRVCALGDREDAMVCSSL